MTKSIYKPVLYTYLLYIFVIITFGSLYLNEHTKVQHLTTRLETTANSFKDCTSLMKVKCETVPICEPSTNIIGAEND